MATVVAEWSPNDPAEGVVRYNMFKDGDPAGQVAAPPFAFTSVPPGPHTFGVQAVNADDPGPTGDANVSDVAVASFTVPHGKPSKPGAFTVHLA